MPLELISLGVVSEDGREFYRQNQAWSRRSTPWLNVNVVEQLDDKSWALPSDIARDLKRFCKCRANDRVEFWGWYAAYDWVFVCRLFGGLMHLPAGWRMICRDVKMLADLVGEQKLPPELDSHHALVDARWIREAWLALQE